ncbi:DUF3987 domain-containing protein [Paracoccus aerius]|uniref:DUF3987 domain-containing protein n=1 Tax=Paracoccus aerius TaxID=1915382 RepID=UPI0036087244
MHGQDSHVTGSVRPFSGHKQRRGAASPQGVPGRPTGPGKDTAVDQCVGQTAQDALRRQLTRRSIAVRVRPPKNWQPSSDCQYALDRVGRGAALIENLSICLLGGIQPEPIRKIAGDTQDDGLLQRLFPIVLHPASQGTDAPAPPVAARYGDLIHALRNPAPIAGGGTFLQFDSDAQKVRRRLEAEHLRMQSTETISRKLASHIGKYDGLFVRLCIVWHCVENAQATQVPQHITAATAERVAAFLHGFLLRHAFAFYAGVLGLSEDHDRLSAIAGHILARRLERITNRDVQRGDKAMRSLRDQDIQPLLQQLAAMGWLERIDGPRPSSAPHWIVNPAVHSRFSARAKAERERRDEARRVLASLTGDA